MSVTILEKTLPCKGFVRRNRMQSSDSYNRNICIKRIRSYICKLHNDIIYPGRLCTATYCCARTDRSTQKLAHSVDFSTSNGYATDLIPCPKLFKAMFPNNQTKVWHQSMVFNWESLLNPCSTTLPLPLCCICSTFTRWGGNWALSVATLCWQNSLVLCLLSPIRVNSEWTNKIT